MNETKDTLADLRCEDCAFRAGSNANKSLSTQLKAQLCAEIPEEFYCHLREKTLCAGWALLANRLNHEGYHAAQPEWKRHLKRVLLDALNRAEQGEDFDLVTVVLNAMEAK